MAHKFMNVLNVIFFKVKVVKGLVCCNSQWNYLVSRFSSSCLSLLDLQKQHRKVSFFLSSRTSSSGAIWAALFPCLPRCKQQWWWWVILTLACPEPLALAFKVTWWWLPDLERDLEVGGDDERDRLRWCSIKGCFGPEIQKRVDPNSKFYLPVVSLLKLLNWAVWLLRFVYLLKTGSTKLIQLL